MPSAASCPRKRSEANNRLARDHGDCSLNSSLQRLPPACKTGWQTRLFRLHPMVLGICRGAQILAIVVVQSTRQAGRSMVQAACNTTSGVIRGAGGQTLFSPKETMSFSHTSPNSPNSIPPSHTLMAFLCSVGAGASFLCRHQIDFDFLAERVCCARQSCQCDRCVFWVEQSV